jgi:hypothetical protein
MAALPWRSAISRKLVGDVGAERQSGPPPRMMGERYRVSLAGGVRPRWRRDGGELFFLSPGQEINSSSVSRGTPPQFAPPVRLLALPSSINGMNPIGVFFDCDEKGTRFLVLNRTHAAAHHMEVILNWQALLKP